MFKKLLMIMTKEKINIAELLKDCQSGMELDCVMFENVTLSHISESGTFPIKISTPIGKISLNKYGGYTCNELSKCVIFPKGKTTWEGFHRPFKDGDVISAIISGKLWYGIYKKEFDRVLYCYVSYSTVTKSIYQHSNVCTINNISEMHFATEEEKEKLFKAIKDNGYRWNSDYKTLEKLVEPQFKIGDRVKSIYNNNQYDIVGLTDTHYTLVEVKNKFKYTEPIIEDKNWELVPNKFDITTLKPFDKVLVRDTNTQKWTADLFSFFDKNELWQYSCVGHYTKQCIPYKGNEHLLGTSNDCDEFYKTW